MRSIDQSFQRLGLNRIDILLIHDVDVWTFGQAYEQRFHEAMAGAYRAIESLRSQGVIKAIGIGVNEIEPCIRFAEVGDFDCLMLAGRHTLLEQGALDELLPLVERKGISIIAGPYNSGILATGAVHGAKYNYREARNYKDSPSSRRYASMTFRSQHVLISPRSPVYLSGSARRGHLKKSIRDVALMSTKSQPTSGLSLSEGLLRSMPRSRLNYAARKTGAKLPHHRQPRSYL
jgi:predicted aldo/keto reductase-like oxidoreductase